MNDANVGFTMRPGEARDDLHGNPPSFARITRLRNGKPDLVARTRDAALAAVGLGEVDESLGHRRGTYLKFHEGSIRSQCPVPETGTTSAVRRLVRKRKHLISGGGEI